MPTMGDLTPAIFGLLGTAVGAAGAIWGARIAARASWKAVAAQQEHAVAHWQREQRRAAYSSLLAVLDQSLELEVDVNDAVIRERGLSEELIARLDAVLQETRAAVTLVDLCGPQSVREAAWALRDAAREALMAVTHGHESTNDMTEEIMAALRLRQTAHEAFRVAASQALGIGD